MLKVTLLSLLEHALAKEFISQTGVDVTVKSQLLIFFVSTYGNNKLLDINKQQGTFYDPSLNIGDLKETATIITRATYYHGILTTSFKWHKFIRNLGFIC